MWDLSEVGEHFPYKGFIPPDRDGLYKPEYAKIVLHAIDVPGSCCLILTTLTI
jgi:hypothetical protein